MFSRILLAFAVLAIVPHANAEWDVGGGMESYQWMESPSGYSGSPRERGPRLAAFVSWTQDRDAGALFGWRAKIYGGTVDYDTFEISTGNPVSTQTEYGGSSSEGQMIFRNGMGGYRMDKVLGLGLDSWTRRIRNGGGYQVEDFSILFLRAGLRIHPGAGMAGFHGEMGIKYPAATREDAHLDELGYTSNPMLKPKGALSGYAEIGYRINARFDIAAYYDSWRFDASDAVIVRDGAGVPWYVLQPISRMDALGVKLLASF
jgi:hypothetical protein